MHDAAPPPSHADDDAPTPPPARREPLAVDAEPIEIETRQPLVPPDKRISLIGWLAAFALFAINKKAGLALMIILVIFRLFPSLNLKSLPRVAGELFRKLR